jgi:purine-binding chemotaxis protein CheW
VSADESLHQYLSFLVAGEEYAIPVLEVKEIIQYSPVTRVPSMPASIRGVANLRGKVVPVVDLAVRFGLPESTITKWSCIVMVEALLDGEPSVVGLLADSVSQVLDLPAEAIEPPPSFGTRVRVEFLQGVGKAGGKFVLLLDLGHLLAGDELRAAAATPAEAPAAPAPPAPPAPPAAPVAPPAASEPAPAGPGSPPAEPTAAAAPDEGPAAAEGPGPGPAT